MHKIITTLFILIFSTSTLFGDNISTLNNKIKTNKKKKSILNAKIYNSNKKNKELQNNLLNARNKRAITEANELPLYVKQASQLRDAIKKLNGGIDTEITKSLHVGIDTINSSIPDKQEIKNLNKQLKKDGKKEIDTYTPQTNIGGNRGKLDINKFADPVSAFIGDNQRIMNSNDPEAILAELSPPLKIIRLKKRRDQYIEMYRGFLKMYNKKLVEIRKKESFKKMIENEIKIGYEIKQEIEYEKSLKNNLRKSRAYLNFLKERLTEEKTKEFLKSEAGKDVNGIPDGEKVSGETSRLKTQKELEIDEQNKDKEKLEKQKEKNDEKEVTEKKDVETNKIFIDVTPIKIVVSNSTNEDCSCGDFRNIVTTTTTVAFWNTGRQKQGFGGAVLIIKSVASLNGVFTQDKITGTFSGGPNGVIKFSGKGGSFSLKVINGTIIKGSGMSFNISNPSAFSYWNQKK
jgi:hypothetical protein